MADVLTPEICIIGGGPAGIAAARAAVALGAEAVLIEKKAMGGANLSAGAVPLAAMMAAASVAEALRRGPSMGVTAAQLQVNWGKVRDHVAGASAAIAAGVSAEHLAAEGIRVLIARARFVSPQAIAAGDTTIRARRFILAVGARPAAPDLPGIGNVEQVTPAEVFDLGRKPTHVLVLGATAEGLVLAQAHQRLGIDATVVDTGPALPGEDPEAVAVLATQLAREGVRLRTNVKVERITRRRGGVRVVLHDPAEGEVTVDGTHLLLAAGRRPTVDGLGLEVAGIAHDESSIAVGRYRTTNRRVYAVGDSISGWPSVVRAEREGMAVVHAILHRLPVRLDPDSFPRATATDPALASIGLGEAAARAKHGDVRIWRYPFGGNERAVADRIPEGMLKVVATRGGRVLGATVLGRDAAEHIALWALAIGNRLPLSALATLAAAYPSRADIARSLAEAANPARLTPSWRKGIIRVLGKFG